MLRQEERHRQFRSPEWFQKLENPILDLDETTSLLSVASLTPFASMQGVPNDQMADHPQFHFRYVLSQRYWLPLLLVLLVGLLGLTLDFQSLNQRSSTQRTLMMLRGSPQVVTLS
jgi:hypothetical protein